ncbi:MAG: macro domain-containing protein [Longimicrobiales bacterium]|nr:macro domain-containing protein [Longimicrobiales bacterium]
MIEFKTGDILAEDAEALVNTVNCVGVMGRGIALQFKKVWPGNFKAYAAACRRDEVQPGRMFVFETRELTGPRYIINFPTKRHWRGRSWRSEDGWGMRMQRQPEWSAVDSKHDSPRMRSAPRNGSCNVTATASPSVHFSMAARFDPRDHD